tara:strand:- start:1800 stop:2243 length:444 start_codon:yes stop_codon:yes gene_type:complete
MSWYYSGEEIAFIKRNFPRVTAKSLAAQLYFISGIKREAEAIKKKAYALGLSPRRKMVKKPKKTIHAGRPKKSKPLPYIVYMPPGRAVIRTREIVRAMENTDTTVKDLARAADLSADTIRALIGKGGMPEPYASRVRGILKIKGGGK